MSAKDLVVSPISAREARQIIEEHHYSRAAYCKSRLHLGVFWYGQLEGVMSFGPPIDQRKMIGLVEDTRWDGFCELNRMAFSPRLPRNSESRALSVALRLFRQHAPQIEWIVSFADGARSGTGAIYRACGFWLTGVRKSTMFWQTSSGEICSRLGLRTSLSLRRRMGVSGVSANAIREAGLTPVSGYMLRYIYGLAPDIRQRLSVAILPYHAATAIGGAMTPSSMDVRPDLAALSSHD